MSGIPYDLNKIKAFAFDVDGVLSPSTIPMHISGEPMRMVNIKDGYAIQLAVKMGYPVAIITGGKTEAVRKRFAVAPRDAAIDVLEIAQYISPYDGGMGCGREVIEQVLRAQNKWMCDKKAFGW